MTASLNSFLKSHRSENIIHSHVSLINPKGKYMFDREELETLWDVYCSAIYENKDENKDKICVGLAEVSQEYIPVIVDADIKIKSTSKLVYGDHLYTTDHVKKVIQIYQSVLSKIIKNCTDKHLLCVVLEKNIYEINKNDTLYIKNGFHLHFPNCFIRKIDYDIHLLPRVLQQLNDQKVFEDLGFSKAEEVIDKNISTVPWLLYGSSKNTDMEPYILTKIYDSSFTELTLREAFSNYKIYDADEKVIEYTKNITYYLPRILSILPYNRKESIVRSDICIMKEIKKKKQSSEPRKEQTESIEANMIIARELLPLLSDFRVTDRNEWLNIGWILFNISDGSDEGLELWCDFSARDEEKYDEAVCNHEWRKMVRKNYNIRSLRYFAGIDNPEAYKKYVDSKIMEHTNTSLSGSHTDVAYLLHSMYSDTFVCASTVNKIWFQFIGHKWEQIEDGVFLRQKLSNKDDPNSIVNIYGGIQKGLYEQMSKLSRDDEKKSIEDKIKCVTGMIKNIKSSPFKANIMKEAMDLFYDRHFKTKIDMNPHLIGCLNGVYDLKLNIFRPGKPEDYISKCMNVEYIEYTDDHSDVISVHDYLEKVFPDKTLRTYFLDTTSETFVGGNHRKLVIFWLGEGDNAKSVTQKFVESLFGPLAIKFNTTIFTGKKIANGAANAELARAGSGVRWAALEEPDGDEQLNIGALKMLSGNDSIFARDLFEKGKDAREITPMFKLAFICNKLPKLKYSDKATWNRIRVLPFEAKFTDDYPADVSEQVKQKHFPVDTEFKYKIPKLLPALLWILLEHRKKMVNFIEPQKVKLATSLYQAENDMYQQFISECIIEVPDAKLGWNETFSKFKIWFKFNSPSTPLPNKQDLRDYLNKRFGDQVGTKWIGLQIHDKISS